MATMRSGTPPSNLQVVSFNGMRFAIAKADAARAAGGRAWRSSRVPAQAAQFKLVPVSLDTFHEGSGFTFDGLPGAYDYCDGWDASSPGKLTTWPRHTTGTATAVASIPPRGWVRFHGGYLWMMRGKLISKYLPSGAAGAWAKVNADFDVTTLVANAVVSGRPDAFKGKLYVALQHNSTGAVQRFIELTTVASGASADTWTLGPAAKTAKAFCTWSQRPEGKVPALVRATGNTVATVAANPMTSGDWGADYEVDDSGHAITDVWIWDKYLMVANDRGLRSFDENLRTINELPDLMSETDATNGQGMTYANAQLWFPHKSALITWMPQAWDNVGPEQEHALEGDLSQGWGRTRALVSRGPRVYSVANESVSVTGAIISYVPRRAHKRGPYVPYCHHQCAGSFEDLCVVTDASDSVSMLVALQVSVDGLTATPWAYKLPRSGMNPADDPAVTKLADAKTFFTSRITAPARSIQKTYHEFSCWLDAGAAATPVGFQVWASVNGAAFYQLLDAAGAAANVSTTGFKRFFFPKTAAAVGNYIQLKYLVETAGAKNANSYTVREGMLYAAARPISTETISCTLVLGESMKLPDGTVVKATIQEQVETLQGLYGPNASPVKYSGPNGESGYAEFEQLDLLETMDQEGGVPWRAANLQFTVTRYS